jgi:predicted enzyme related to lactoylglutathione lyase
MATLPLRGLVPMAHVVDVARSIEFYRQIGFKTRHTLEHGGRMRWAWMENGKAHLMLALSSGVINAEEQAVLFYLYAPDVTAYRAELMEGGIKVGPLSYPAYMPEGEFRIHDPDGYVLLVGQTDTVSL